MEEKAGEHVSFFLSFTSFNQMAFLSMGNSVSNKAKAVAVTLRVALRVRLCVCVSVCVCVCT